MATVMITNTSIVTISKIGRNGTIKKTSAVRTDRQKKAGVTINQPQHMRPERGFFVGGCRALARGVGCRHEMLVKGGQNRCNGMSRYAHAVDDGVSWCANQKKHLLRGAGHVATKHEFSFFKPKVGGHDGGPLGDCVHAHR